MKNNQSLRVPLYIIALFIICLITLCSAGISNYQNLQILKQDNERVDRSWNAKYRLKKINILIIESENSVRKYFLSGNVADLNQWKAAENNLADEFSKLEKFVDNKPVQIAALMQFRKMVYFKLKELETCIIAFDNGLSTESALRLNQGQEVMNEIHRLDRLFQHEESDSITERQINFFNKFNNAVWTGIVINAVAALTLVLFYRLISLSFAKQRATEEQLKSANDNLECMVQTRTRQLSVLSHHLLRVSEEEKAKLARELHDELGASLTAVGMDISIVREKLADKEPALADQLLRAKQTLNETVNLKRRIMENLRPSMLDNLGLAASIRHHCEEISRINGLRFEVRISEEFTTIDPVWAITLYRITQEALTNVMKYAQATVVKITLQRQTKGLWLQILDDGIGISSETLEKPKAHGMSGMRERTLLLNGTFSVRPGENGRGCAIDVFIPFPISG